MVSRSRRVMSCSPLRDGGCAEDPAHIYTSPAPGERSKFKLQDPVSTECAYHYHTIIKSKNCKLNHPTSVKTVCSSLLPGSPPWDISKKETAASPPLRPTPPGTTTQAHTPFPLAFGDTAVLPPARRRSKPLASAPPSAHLPGCLRHEAAICLV